MYVYIYVNMYVYIYIYIYVDTYTYIYICIFSNDVQCLHIHIRKWYYRPSLGHYTFSIGWVFDCLVSLPRLGSC